MSELRARVESLEHGLKTLAEVMSDGGGRLQTMQAAVHALIVTNPNGAAFGPRLQNALDVMEANTLATSMNDVYVDAMQAAKEACLGDLAQIAPAEAGPGDKFIAELVRTIVWTMIDKAKAPA